MIFYKDDDSKQSFSSLKVGLIQVDFRTLYITIISAIILIPATIILGFSFRNRRLKNAPHVPG